MKNYEPDLIDWQIKDSSWVKLERAVNESGLAADFTMDSFKAFFDGMMNHYCAHF